MNATFRTDCGVSYVICDSLEPLDPGTKPGEIVAVSGRVMLMVHNMSGTNSISAALRKSEARAIASALMGAAAEL